MIRAFLAGARIQLQFLRAYPDALIPFFTAPMFSVIFLMSAFGKVTNWSGTEGYMASHGMPAVPVLLALAVLFEAGGGLCLLLGFQNEGGELKQYAQLLR